MSRVHRVRVGSGHGDSLNVPSNTPIYDRPRGLEHARVDVMLSRMCPIHVAEEIPWSRSIEPTVGVFAE